MNRFLKRTRDLILTQQNGILASTVILAGMMILSRIFGFLRYRILAGFFTKEILDVFFAAFRVPDLVFEVLINGALSTTFIPYFIEYRRNSEQQSEIISSIINVISIFVMISIVLLYIGMPYLVPLIAPGFNPEKMQQTIYFSRLILLGQLPFLVLGNFLTGISQARKKFILPAFAPIIYNLAIIAMTYAFANQFDLLAPVIGVVVGAVLFFVIQLPVATYAGFSYSLVVSHFKHVYRFFRTAIPRVMTIVVSQIDATVDLTLASLLGSGSYTIYYLAQHLQLLPVSIVGMAFGQASLPYLTEVYQDRDLKKFRFLIVHSILNILFLTIPAAAFLIIARTPLVRLFFGGEKFDWEGTVLTARTLSYFAISIPLHAMYYFLTRCFYAFFDTKTPFYASFVSIGVNAVLSIYFTLVLGLPVWSLALSFSVAIILNVCILFILLYRRVQDLAIIHLAAEVGRITLATFIASITSYFSMKLIDGLILDTSRTLNVFFLLAITGILFLAIFLILCWLFGIHELYVIGKIARRARTYRKKLLEVYDGIE